MTPSNRSLSVAGGASLTTDDTLRPLPGAELKMPKVKTCQDMRSKGNTQSHARTCGGSALRWSVSTSPVYFLGEWSLLGLPVCLADPGAETARAGDDWAAELVAVLARMGVAVSCRLPCCGAVLTNMPCAFGAEKGRVLSGCRGFGGRCTSW